jgi:CreA protein
MRRSATFLILGACAALLSAGPAEADHVGSYVYKRNWGCLGLCQNDFIGLESFKDKEIPGIVCHMSRAVNGSWSPLAEDPSDNSLACRQNGPITVDLNKLKAAQGSSGTEVFSQATSAFFKSSTVHRFIDVDNGTIIYLTTSTKLFDGSPKNSISTVTVMPWGR